MCCIRYKWVCALLYWTLPNFCSTSFLDNLQRTPIKLKVQFLNSSSYIDLFFSFFFVCFLFLAGPRCREQEPVRLPSSCHPTKHRCLPATSCVFAGGWIGALVGCLPVYFCGPPQYILYAAAKKKKTVAFIRLNISYPVFVAIESRLKWICKSLHSAFIHVLRSVPTWMELGFINV